MNSNKALFSLLLLSLLSHLIIHIEAKDTNNVFQTDYIFIQKKTSSARRCGLNVVMDKLLKYCILDPNINPDDFISSGKLGKTEDLPMQLAGHCQQRNITLPKEFELAEGPGTVGDCLYYGAMRSSNKTKKAIVLILSDKSWNHKDNDGHRLGILCEERIKKLNFVISCPHSTDAYKPDYTYTVQELICINGNIEVGKEWSIELPDHQLMMSCEITYGAGVLGRILDGPNKTTGLHGNSNAAGSINKFLSTGVLLVLMMSFVLFLSL